MTTPETPKPLTEKELEEMVKLTTRYHGIYKEGILGDAMEGELLSMANKLIAELKRLRAGPSEEDMAKLKRVIDFHKDHLHKLDDPQNPRECIECWSFSKLQKEWGIE